MAKRKTKRTVKPAKYKATGTAKKKSTTKRHRSGNPWEIDNVPTLI